MFNGQLIGVDVGGTKVAVAALEDERLSDSVIQPTEASNADDLLGELVSVIESVRAPNTAGIGVGVPSVVEFATGHVRSSTNLRLADLDLRRVLEDRLGLPVFVDNDATASRIRFVLPPVVDITTGMSPVNSQRIWRHAPQGGVGSSAPVTTAIPLNCRTPSESAFQTATRSAQTVRPYVEFSTLQPVKIVPSAASSRNSRAAANRWAICARRASGSGWR